MAELSIGGEAFHVVIEGDENAPVLMLSNAIGTNLHMWDQQVPAFLSHYRVLRYDSRGHGSSVVSEGPYSIADLGKDALAILDALNLDKVDFLGLSLGGIVGQWLLTHAPKRIGKAVLADTASQLAPADLWNSRIQTVLQDGMEAVVSGTIEHWFTKGFRDSNAEQIALIEDMILKTPPQGYASTCAALRDVDLREAVRSIQAPVLVMVGRHDDITPPGIGALMTSSIPKAKLVTLEAAHLSNVEDPDQFAEKALEFLLAASEPVAEVAPKKPRKPPVKKAKPVEAAPVEVAAAPVPEPAPVEKAAPKKAAAKKKPAVTAPPAKKAPAKEAAVKKAPAKKAPAKKAATKKAAAKKAPVKKMAVKKAAPKKAMAKKAVKKATAKKAAIKKTAIKKSVPKKAVKKTAVKKIAAKKTAVKKLMKKAPPSRKTGSVKASRKPMKKTAAKKSKKR